MGKRVVNSIKILLCIKVTAELARVKKLVDVLEERIIYNFTVCQYERLWEIIATSCQHLRPNLVAEILLAEVIC